jgi:hypothetical protein
LSGSSPHRLSGMGDATSSHAVAGIALKNIWPCQPRYLCII